MEVSTLPALHFRADFPTTVGGANSAPGKSFAGNINTNLILAQHRSLTALSSEGVAATSV